MAGLPVTAGTGGSGLNVAGDIVGTATTPTTGDRIQYIKLDLGTAGNSSPVSGAVPTQNTATTSGGATPSGFLADGSTYQGVIKASAGQLYKLSVSNTNTGNLYLRIYNKATNPVPGTDTPIWRDVIPPGGREIQISDIGIAFTTGISWVFTSGSLSDSDVTPVVVTTGSINYAYK